MSFKHKMLNTPSVTSYNCFLFYTSLDTWKKTLFLSILCVTLAFIYIKGVNGGKRKKRSSKVWPCGMERRGSIWPTKRTVASAKWSRSRLRILFIIIEIKINLESVCYCWDSARWFFFVTKQWLKSYGI